MFVCLSSVCCLHACTIVTCHGQGHDENRAYLLCMRLDTNMLLIVTAFDDDDDPQNGIQAVI